MIEKHMNTSISVIIAAYNEERTLSSIIEIVRSWGRTKEIIVVDDGSGDQTVKSVRQFVPGITLIRHAKNQGKASAMVDGVRKSSGAVLLFLDADTVGLTHRDLDSMVQPMLQGKADMVLGAARFWSAGTFEPFNHLTGQRVIFREALLPELDKMRSLGYGVELFINKLHEKKRVKTVKLPHVFILGKREKQTLPDALQSYVKEIRDLLTQLITQYADEIGPHAKKIVKEIVRYSLRVLDSLMP